MKRVVLIILIISIAKIQCHVINRTKTELTTQFYFENETRDNLPKDDENKKYNATKEKVEEAYVYLDDVLFSLENQNWSEEEKPCLDHIHRMLDGLQNFTLWAVWDWDAQSSEPQGLLFANRYQLGNFDQCMNAPWASIHTELNTKYCLADIVLERTDKSVRKRVDNPFNPYQSALDFIEYRPPHAHPLNELTWGACVPATCQSATVERLLRIMLARSHLGTAGIRANISITEPCQTKEDRKEYDGLFYGFVAMVGVLVGISIMCTLLNSNKNRDSNSTGSGFVRAFCLKENASDLLKMKQEGLEVFYGIKFLTMCLIVLDHQIGIYNSGPISDGFISDQVPKSPLGMLILHDDLFVDTFFLLSGFLAITYLASVKKLPNPLLIIFKRYLRLVIALAIVVFYACAVFPYTGSGPLWNRVNAVETDACLKNWWLNLLMVNNYIDTENMCIVVSWYIPCDFHFFVVIVLLFWMFKQSPGLGMICGGLVTVAAFIVPGMVTYMYELNAVQLFTFEFVSNPRGSREFHGNYIKSHTRFAAYLVGVFSGYFFMTYKDKIGPKKISKIWSIFGATSALVFMLVIMVSGNIFLWWDYHPMEGAVYAALNRPAWACGVALLVMCCAFGQVPLVRGMLTWYPWVPLSRLTYGLYLTHTIVILRNVFTTRNPHHNDYFNILNEAAGVIFLSCIAALLLWLFAEAPANKLLMLCLKARIKKFETKSEVIEDDDASRATSSKNANGGGGRANDDGGNLQPNLPTTISFSSKM